MAGFDIILFDFDGVIMNHATAEFTAKKALAKPFFHWTEKAKVELTPAKVVRIFEMNDATHNKDFIINIYQKFAPYISKRRSRFWFFLYMGRKVRINEKKVVEIVPGVPDMLKRLHEAGVFVGIVSSSQQRRITNLLKQFGNHEYVDILVTRDEIKKYGLKLKPAPDPVIYAMVHLKRKHRLTIDKNRVLFIGDLPSDIQTGKDAGVKTAGVLTGHGYRHELEDMNPDFILKSAPEMFLKIPALAELESDR